MSIDALRPLFGHQQEEVNAEAARAASAPAQEQEAAPSTKLDRELYDKLLGVIGDMDKAAVRSYLTGKKRIPEGGWIE